MKTSYVVLLLCFINVISAYEMSRRYEDDDWECRRHKNEGFCLRSDQHSSCACLFHEKPNLSISEWNEEEQIRTFKQNCEPLKLPFHEDTCKVFPGNPNDLDEYEFLCPNKGFFQTWGAFAPKIDTYNIRLWYRCCEVLCPAWLCQWSPFNDVNEGFVAPLRDAYVQGVRGRYFHEKKDSIWSLKICRCDFSASAKEEL